MLFRSFLHCLEYLLNLNLAISLSKVGMKMESNEIHQIIEQNQRLLQNLNTQRHCECEIRQLISEIIGAKISDSVEIRLPFFTDYGRNIKFGKDIFINFNVTMVDLGGIVIEDHVFIGPGAYLISVNHMIDPKRRKELILKRVHLEKMFGLELVLRFYQE